MSASQQSIELEELAFLRQRVAELELRVAERTRAASSLEEHCELLETLLGSTPAGIRLSDELGRSVYANRAISESVREIRSFPILSRSGKRYTASIAPDLNASEAARAQALFHCELLGVLECTGRTLDDLAISGANSSILQWLGYSADEITGMNWRALSSENFLTRDRQALTELQSGGAWQPFEREFLDSAGRPVPVLVSARALGDGTSFLCFVLNLSDRRKLEESMLRSQKLESLGLIAGGVAHDFNNLLATIMGNASLSLEAVSPQHPAFKPLNEVVMASRRASELTQQVLAYSGRAAFHIAPLDLSAAVREIGSLLETTISKKIELKFELAAGLPYINADEGQLQQVIMNLVINASDAIGEMPGEIVVRSREIRTREPGRSVCFEVSDTGAGMSEETRARIFDPFFTTKSNGRGLGLAAVLGIVRNHCGTLLVESRLGIGTTFRILLPATDAEPVRAEPVHPHSDLFGTETILVADDDEAIRRMTKAALERFGYRVLLAANGEEAVTMFREHRGVIAVVLLDWAMPVMNGDEALKRILALDPAAKIMMSSGYAETETLRRVNAPVLAGFVQKPYTTTQLAERLREAIRA